MPASPASATHASRVKSSAGKRALFALAIGCMPAAATQETRADDLPRRYLSPPASAQPPFAWDLSAHLAAPATHPVDDPALPSTGGITPIFFESIAWNGQASRVFAWLGIPPGDGDGRGKRPGIVLVHGAGGTAYRDWVKLWNDRGYAAIALDTVGTMPLAPEGMARVETKRHAYSGSPFFGGGFGRALDPVETQWPCHAVAAIVRAHSLLLAQPQVDPDRTGITGISWGGILTEIAASLDSRFKFAAPVYGCGYLGENSSWLETVFQTLPPESVSRWIALWDPSQYLGLSGSPAARTPFLFVNGTNDRHFRPDSWRKTARLAATTGRSVTRILKVRLPHDHPPAGDPAEITRFADSILRNDAPLPRVTGQTRDGIRWESSPAAPVVKAELVYTLDAGPWPDRRWQTRAAVLAGENNHATASIPPAATAWYWNLHDNRGHVVSGEHREAGEERP